jgi:hypothetical protein
LLHGDASRAAVQQAVAEQDGAVKDFLERLVAEQEKQDSEKSKGKSGIVDNSQCLR